MLDLELMKNRQYDALESHETIARVVARRGVKQIAREMNISSTLLYKWCQPRVCKKGEGPEGSGTANPLDRLERLIRLTDGEELLVWLCQKNNGFFTKNPSTHKNNSADIFESIQRIVKEFSDTLDAISASHKQGGDIDELESHRIRREWDQLKSVGESLVVACESGQYRKKQKKAMGGK